MLRDGFKKPGLTDVVAHLLLRNGLFDEARQLLVGAAAAHDSIQVMVKLRKEASANLAVGSQPDAAGLPAERSRYRRNDANLPPTHHQAHGAEQSSAASFCGGGTNRGLENPYWTFSDQR